MNQRRGASLVSLCHEDGTALPLRVRRCDTFLCRLRGLTFRRSLPADEGLLFIESAESRLGTSIHMFFVFFDIGVVWLAADGTVVDAKLAKPFRPYYAPQSPARYYLEGPPALLTWVRVGERLSIRSEAA
ncbi:MAG TPA: DUF192 domain-containing protein [Anaerolineae bacterium]|nr:DUF192 domain-containing protein [Anaerolineae bacterium]HQH39116.1 DUF192 domain-containing protein [Anaerolineae bacterium]